MTTEQILEKIKKERGESALRDGQSLLGLFRDYSHNQLLPQANALRTFLECRGNQRILNLCSEPTQKQQTEYHRLVQEMVRDYNMQEATAADICAAFWRVAIGTEPPVSKPVPEPKQQLITFHPEAASQSNASQEVSGESTAPKAAAVQIHEHKAQESVQTTTSPAKEQRNGMGKRIAQRFRNMTIFERVTFLIGLCGTVLYSPAFVSACYDTVIAGEDPRVYLSISIGPLLAIWRMCLLWKRGFGSLFSGGFLEKVDCTYSKVLMWPNMLGCISVVAIVFALGCGWDDGVWTNIFITASIAGFVALSAFNTIWHWEKSL